MPRIRSRRWLVAPAVALAVLAAGVVTLAAYGVSTPDGIRAGVSVAGVDLGGMDPAAARRELERRFGPSIRRPVIVNAGARTFRLTARQSGVRLDLDAMVAEAMAHSPGHDPLSRGVRRLWGGIEPQRLPLRVTYSQRAVAQLVARVRRATDRTPRSARLRFTGRRLRSTPERPGREVRGAALLAAVEREIISRGERPAIAAPMRTVPARPPTLADLRRRNPWVIGISRPRKELRLYHRLRLQRTYRIAVGAIGYDTPAGRYRVQSKAINPVWTPPPSPWTGGLAGRHIPPGPENPLKARWIGIADGAGIHGTTDLASLGTAASHGCIRMSVPDVVDLYRHVEVGSPIFIV